MGLSTRLLLYIIAAMIIWEFFDNGTGKILTRRIIVFVVALATVISFQVVLEQNGWDGYPGGISEAFSDSENPKADQTDNKQALECFLEGDDSTFGESLNNKILSSDATSFLTAKAGTYPASNVTDGMVETCWQEGVEGDGLGETLTFSFSEPVDVNHMLIYNGKARSDEDYEKNGRICRLEIIRQDGSSCEMTLEDTRQPQYCTLKGFTDVTMIQLRILEVYTGTYYQDTCLSEVEFFN